MRGLQRLDLAVLRGYSGEAPQPVRAAARAELCTAMLVRCAALCSKSNSNINISGSSGSSSSGSSGSGGSSSSSSSSSSRCSSALAHG